LKDFQEEALKLAGYGVRGKAAGKRLKRTRIGEAGGGTKGEGKLRL